jgi:hypothetical protein
MTSKDWALILSFLGGAMMHQYLKDKITIRFVYLEPEEVPAKDFATEMMFDCPACGLPAQLDRVLTQMNEGEDYENYYILDCLGEHDPVATSEEWFRENVGRI